MSQPKPWTLVKNGEFYLTLKIDGSDCGIVTSLKVPRQPDYEDEHVLIFCNDSSEPKMLSLNLLDSKGSDFFKQFNVGELSNSADFIKAVLALCPIEAPFSAALRGLSNLDGYANSKEYDRMSNSSELSFELEMPDKINPIDLSDSSSNISAPLLASTPVPKPDPKQRNNKGSKQPFNNTVGIALFDGHRSIGKVIGEELPKFGEIGWPPPFRKTVNIMREFLLNNCGHFRLWTTGSLQFQKAYFNRVFGLHETKDSLISKIDELTQRLQTVKDKNKEIITENKELNKTVARLRNDISRCNEDNTTLKMDNEKLKAENEKLLKAIEVEKSNNSFLTTSLEEKEQQLQYYYRKTAGRAKRKYECFDEQENPSRQLKRYHNMMKDAASVGSEKSTDSDIDIASEDVDISDDIDFENAVVEDHTVFETASESSSSGESDLSSSSDDMSSDSENEDLNAPEKPDMDDKWGTGTIDDEPLYQGKYDKKIGEIRLNKPTKKAKGITKTAKNTLDIDDYRDCLYGGKPVLREMNVIRSRDHDIYLETINKVALSNLDDKRIVLKDQIHTNAIGYVAFSGGSSVSVTTCNSSLTKFRFGAPSDK
ncbi:hypothetical protein AC249_AIPGENE24891 [Exaiptasia diaphana]|nr:hypothetical protein AC249_AIPGENE24891 [Exaiptasia diaphana]